MRTRRSISTAMSRASLVDIARCNRTASTIWSPIRITGLSEVMGSWKIMEMRLPGIEDVAQGVTEQVCAEHGEADRNAGEDHKPRRGADIFGGGFREHAAP